MKKILLILMLLTVPAWCEEDDSTPYMPFPEQPPQVEQPKTQPAKKTPAKKKTKKPVQKKKAPEKKTVKKAPAPRSSSLQQGIALMQQDRYQAAKPYLLKAIQENRNDPNAWYWYGVYHEKTGGFYQAQYFYSKAVTIDPAFEPLSRIVYYPEDKEKTPLWDPKRPARVYPVETSGRGIAAVPPNAKDRKRFPSAPNDPELPKVPVYVPPEPGASPLEGDSWSPAVYVPPAPEEVQTEGEHSPLYIPPEAQSVTVDENINIIDNSQREVIEIPLYQQNENFYEYEAAENSNGRDTVIRADKPLYNPPEPGQRIALAKTQKKISQPSVEKQQPKTPRKIVRQSDKKNKTPAKSQPTQKQNTERNTTRRNSKRTVSRDVRPSVPSQPRQTQQTERQPESSVQSVRPREPEIHIEDSQPEVTDITNENHYLPPVGQFAPDPGTLPETYIPPVGQGNQN